MELLLILRVLLRRWWLVVIPVAVVGVFAVPQLLNRTPSAGGYAAVFRYTAAQRFNLPERDGDYQDVWLASEFTVNAFTEWIRRSTFRAEIVKIVGEDVDLSLLGVNTDNQRSVGVVEMSYPDEAMLQRIVAAAIEVLQTRSQDYFPHLGGEPAQVSVLDAPVIIDNPPPLGNRFAPVLQMGVALLAGIGLAFLAEYFDDRLRRREEVEAQGLRVLAAIPKHKSTLTAANMRKDRR